MADATAIPSVPQQLSALDIHPKVSMAIFAGSATTVIIPVLKAKFGIDLTGYESAVTVLVMGLVSYFVPNA